jgi:hypothetical protein
MRYLQSWKKPRNAKDYEYRASLRLPHRPNIGKGGYIIRWTVFDDKLNYSTQFFYSEV